MKPALNKKFDKLMERSQEQIWRKKFDESLKTLSEALDLLKSENETTPETWAWVYDQRRYALYEAGRIDDAVAECKRAIEHLSGTNWPYLEEHNHVRATLRAAHNMIAWTLAERATNEKEALVALEHIKTCFATVSPIEDKDTLNPFLETRSVVFQKLTTLANDSENYRPHFYESLVELYKKNRSDLDNNASLKAVTQSDDFKAHLANDPVMKLCTTPESETAAEAIERFKRALDYVGTTNESYASYYEFEQREPLSDDRIREYETAFGMSLPPALKQLAIEHGPFSVGSCCELTVLDGWNEPPRKCGLVEYIDYAWGGRPEFEEFYKPAQIEYLNKNYFVFGMRCQDDNCHDYFFFDREGNFSSIFMDQDCFGYFQDTLNPLLKKSTASQTLDQLLSEQITHVIRKVMDLEE